MKRRSDAALMAFLTMLGDFKPASVVQSGLGSGLETAILREAFPAAVFTAFEPNLHWYKKWKTTWRGLYPGKIVRCALGNSKGRRSFYCAWDRSSFHKPSSRICEVRVERLDDLDAGELSGRFPAPALWILDCEGHEFHVLCGAKRFLEKCHAVIVEVNDPPPCDGWCGAREVHFKLTVAGFLHRLYVGDWLRTRGNSLYARRIRPSSVTT